jgi:hypothetical protein
MRRKSGRKGIQEQANVTFVDVQQGTAQDEQSILDIQRRNTMLV